MELGKFKVGNKPKAKFRWKGRPISTTKEYWATGVGEYFVTRKLGFAKPKEILNYYHEYPYPWGRKGLHGFKDFKKTIRLQGVREPVMVDIANFGSSRYPSYAGVLSNGHHRTMAAYLTRKNKIPVDLSGDVNWGVYKSKMKEPTEKRKSLSEVTRRTSKRVKDEKVLPRKKKSYRLKEHS